MLFDLSRVLHNINKHYLKLTQKKIQLVEIRIKIGKTVN